MQYAAFRFMGVCCIDKHQACGVSVCVALFYKTDIGESLCTVPGLHRERAKGHAS